MIGTPRSAGVLAVLALVGACSSGPVLVGKRPPANPTLLGGAHASSCGLVFLNLLPFGVNGRLRSAYEEAQLAIGKRDVVDTRLTEHWYTIPLVGTVLCTDVELTAVQ